MNRILRFVLSEDGPTAVEYAVLLALIISVVIVAITTVGGVTQGMWDGIEADFTAHGIGS